MRRQNESPSLPPTPFDIDIDVEPEVDPRPSGTSEITDADRDERATELFLRVVKAKPVGRRTGRVLRRPHVPTGVETRGDDLEQAESADRRLSDAELSADEAARNEHHRRVVAPLLMLLALGLLIGAGWSC